MLSDPVIGKVAEKYGKTPAQIILRWNVDRGVVVIPKLSNPKRQAENLEVLNFKLEDEDIKLICSLNKNKRLGSDPDNFNF